MALGLFFLVSVQDTGILGAPVKTGDEAPDFSLLDQDGKFYELRRQHGARAVVLFFTGNGCPIARQSVTKLKALRAKYPKIAFWMVNANPQDDRESILSEAREFGISFPILKDDSQMVAKAFDIKRTAEVIAIGTDDWKVFYRGGMDDQFSQGAGKPEPTKRFLDEALAGFLNHKDISRDAAPVAGCLIRYELPEKPVSYARDVAPILQKNCVSCHSDGNIGPFSMNSHKKVHGYADQIREEVLTRRMPPWHADPKYGKFQENRLLTVAETQTLLTWVEQGALEGEGEDPLALAAKSAPPAPEWALGKPDFVVTPTQRMTIPPTGVIDYITNVVESPITSDVWIKGAVIRPDNRKVLHHVIVYLEYPNDKDQKIDRWNDRWLVGWAPGAQAHFYPEGTGKFLPKGSKLRFQLHYTPYGKETTDLTELGLYVHQQRPPIALEIRGVTSPDFKIQPNLADSRTLAIQELPRDTTIYEMSPHMHKRGSWFRYEALYPDGKFETLLSVPHYDFNWQSTYRLAEPKVVPAGTRILCTGGFDNSKYNPSNPNPNAVIRWGDQSFDEMFIGFMTVSETTAKPATSVTQARVE